MSISLRRSNNKDYDGVAINSAGEDLHWILDDGKTHVVVLHDRKRDSWWITNKGMHFEEGPFETVDQAVVYCNLRYTSVKHLLSKT